MSAIGSDQSRHQHIGNTLPRSPLAHAIISEGCREIHDDALLAATEELRQAYNDLVRRHGDVFVHVLLVAEWPEHEDGEPGEEQK